jgi:hypothetical protein
MRSELYRSSGLPHWYGEAARRVKSGVPRMPPCVQLRVAGGAVTSGRTVRAILPTIGEAKIATDALDDQPEHALADMASESLDLGNPIASHRLTHPAEFRPATPTRYRQRKNPVNAINISASFDA